MSFYVPASSFSAFIGRNPYQTREDTISKLYDRYVLKIQDPLVIPEEYNHIVSATKLSNEQYSMLADAPEDVRSSVRQARGTHLESNGLVLLSKALHGSKYEGCKIELDNRHYKVTLDSIILGGRMDGLLVNEEGTQAIIEVKNRVRGPFSYDKLSRYNYDLDQLMCYYILTGRRYNTLLVQASNGELYVNEFTAEYMDKRWKECQDVLEESAELVSAL